MRGQYSEEKIKEALRPCHSADAALNRKLIDYAKEKEREEELQKSGVMRMDLRRRFATAAAAFAAVLILGTGAYAATQYFGLDFFASRNDGPKLTEEVKQMIEEKPEVTVQKTEGSRDILNYEVSEVLCDSRNLVATVEISVKEPDKYFVFTGTDDVVTPMEILQMGIDSMDTIGTYCKKRGMQPVLVDVDCFDEKTGRLLSNSLASTKYTSPGKVTYMFSANRLTADREFVMGLKPTVCLFDGEKQVAIYRDDLLEVQVKDKSTEQTAFYEPEKKEPVEVAGGNSCSIDRAELISTEVGSYLTVDYTWHGEKSDECQIFWTLCDADGKEVSRNPLVVDGGCEWLGGKHWQSKLEFVNIGQPDVIHIREIAEDGGRVITLKKKK